MQNGYTIDTAIKVVNELSALLAIYGCTMGEAMHILDLVEIHEDIKDECLTFKYDGGTICTIVRGVMDDGLNIKGDEESLKAFIKHWLNKE